ncbi:SDR family NAD(P)-dependent oxidoreductase [Photobacterium leiognathi]|uniref:SDR family NAD(P)-dependent oxidoreductase n=1 Tax=Photobacterium leiognathi TaxID=553611 RepID=UPI0027375644|nr:SDR family NAD(P)-dependent oxidoreductase [Photobacterium leiognathi]
MLIHGRNKQKLADSEAQLKALNTGSVYSYLADLTQVSQLAEQILAEHQHFDVLINNSGVFKTPVSQTAAGLDLRFVVNTLAPYLLTQLLMPIFDTQSRVVNLSSAAQDSVDFAALRGEKPLEAMLAYAQSKLAITIWSKHMAEQANSPVVIAVNPFAPAANMSCN